MIFENKEYFFYHDEKKITYKTKNYFKYFNFMYNISMGSPFQSHLQTHHQTSLTSSHHMNTEHESTTRDTNVSRYHTCDTLLAIRGSGRREPLLTLITSYHPSVGCFPSPTFVQLLWTGRFSEQLVNAKQCCSTNSTSRKPIMKNCGGLYVSRVQQQSKYPSHCIVKKYG